MPYIDDFKTLRVGAGLKIVTVARTANLSEDTIQRIEKRKDVSHVSCVAAVHSLNALHYAKNGSALDPAGLVTMKSRFGEND